MVFFAHGRSTSSLPLRNANVRTQKRCDGRTSSASIWHFAKELPGMELQVVAKSTLGGTFVQMR